MQFRPLPLRRSFGLGLLLGLWLAFAPARAADIVAYEVRILPTALPALNTALAASSGLISLRKPAPVGGFALLIRARADQDRLISVLHSFGYYDGTIRITINDWALDAPDLATQLGARPEGQATKIAIAVTPGRLFHLGRVQIGGNPPVPLARLLPPVAPGAPAVAAIVLAASDRLAQGLADAGYAYAKVASPVVEEREADGLLDVTYPVAAGPRVDLGPIRVLGLTRANPAFVQRLVSLQPGQVYSPAAIDRTQQALMGTGIFASVQPQLAAVPDAQGRAPLDIRVAEQPLHVVGANAAYSTDLGASAGLTWSDRDLFGNAEQLNLHATATELGGGNATAPGYDIGAQFIKPYFLAPEQQFTADLATVRQYLESYDRIALTGDARVNRTLGPHWNVGLGVSAEQEQIFQEGTTNDYTLLGLPATLNFDNSNSLLDATRGVRAGLQITPTTSLAEGSGGRNAVFVLLQANAATYLDVGAWAGGAAGRSVLALRGLMGSAQGASQFQLPPDQRFYAGGSGSVRGYIYQSIGPRFADNYPQGGAAFDAGTIEFRQRILASYGVVGFVDAGQVSAGSAPFQGAVQIGAGVGARYYTSFGPIRLDVAVPVNPRPGDASFELYIGLGQAF